MPILVLGFLGTSALKGSERVKGPSILGGGTGTWMLAIGFFFASWMVQVSNGIQWPTLWLQLTELFSAQAGEHPVFLSDQAPAKKIGPVDYP